MNMNIPQHNEKNAEVVDTADESNEDTLEENVYTIPRSIACIHWGEGISVVSSVLHPSLIPQVNNCTCLNTTGSLKQHMLMQC